MFRDSRGSLRVPVPKVLRGKGNGILRKLGYLSCDITFCHIVESKIQLLISDNFICIFHFCGFRCILRGRGINS